MDANMDAIRVVVTRGDLVESVHRVDAVVADTQGKALAACGQADLVTYWRSSAKPFQALPLIRKALAEGVGFSDEEVAIMCASHAGEPEHVALVARLLERFGLSEEHLACGAHPPLHEPSAVQLWRAGKSPGRIHSNCSGKHTGMLIHAKLIGADLSSYLDPSHPVQQAIIATVEAFAGVPRDEIKISIDGCGAPVFGLSLLGMATAYARLSAPGGIFDEATSRAAERIVQAMQAKPFFVAGTGRLCTALMETLGPAVVAKGGAEGVYCVGLPQRGWGIALKVRDGAARATGPAIIEILAALGVVEAQAAAALEEHRTPVVRNVAGRPVGRIRAELPRDFEEQLRVLGENAASG